MTPMGWFFLVIYERDSQGVMCLLQCLYFLLTKVTTGGEDQRGTVQLEEQESELVFSQGSKIDEVEEEALLEDCHCVLVVFSVTDLGSLREAEDLLQGLWQSSLLNTKAVIVVGNKIDLVRTREVPIDGGW